MRKFKGLYGPAEILAHEFGHAKHKIEDPKAYRQRRRDISTEPFFTDAEEKKTIKEFDTRQGKVRTTDFGKPYKAKSVTSTEEEEKKK